MMSADNLAMSFPLAEGEMARIVASSVPHARQGLGAKRDHRPCVVAIGAFDGVHRGHRALIDACRNEAMQTGARSVVVTFDPDPAELFAPTAIGTRLLDIADRVSLFDTDDVLVLPFTQDLASLAPDGFVRRVKDLVGPIQSMHVGVNFHFGVGAAAGVDDLRALGAQHGFTVVAHDLLICDGAPVSSTRIRGLLAQGSLAQATKLLGRFHFVRGTVLHGRGEGTSFGFPTANVSCNNRACLPAEGVYACLVTDGVHAWPSAANVGAPPSFSEHRDAFLEANLIGFDGDLYGRELAVVFVKWLRASRPFSSLDELERVVLGNIAWVRDNIGAEGVTLGS